MGTMFFFVYFLDTFTLYKICVLSTTKRAVNYAANPEQKPAEITVTVLCLSWRSRYDRRRTVPRVHDDDASGRQHDASHVRLCSGCI